MLGIIILNYNNYNDTVKCIDSIRNCGDFGEYKIYVVDNRSVNESYGFLVEKYERDSDVKVILSDKNGGFSAGNNIGFKIAVGDGCDVLLCSNNDVEYKNGSIGYMLESLNSDTACAVVGPKVYNSDGTIQNRNKGILDYKTFIYKRRLFEKFDFKNRVKKYRYSDYDYSYPLKPSGMVSGCCFMIRSRDLQEVGWLDENVFLYHEEDILGAKIRKIGKYVLLDPRAEIVHAEGKSTGKSTPFLRYNTIYSGLYYLKVYGNATKSQFNKACFVAKFLFFMKSLFDKEYKKEYGRLKASIKRLKSAEVNGRNV